MPDLTLPEGSKFTQDPLENRRIWVAALRSDMYGQTPGKLRNEGGFCCLGVACDLYDSGAWVRREYLKGEPYFDFLGMDDELPCEVGVALGLTVAFVADTKLQDGRDLADLNDSGTRFPEIANLIEAQPPEWKGETVRENS